MATAVKEHKLCLTQMDMEGALTIHSYGIQPSLVLTMPKSEKDHFFRLKKRFGIMEYFTGGASIGERGLLSQERTSTVQDIINYIIEEVIELTERRKDTTTNSSESFLCSIDSKFRVNLKN